MRNCYFSRQVHMFDSLTLSLSPEKYDYVGKLLKPGEEPSEYTDDEEVKDKKKE